jgi:hypothetical protein
VREWLANHRRQEGPGIGAHPGGGAGRLSFWSTAAKDVHIVREDAGNPVVHFDGVGA